MLHMIRCKCEPTGLPLPKKGKEEEEIQTAHDLGSRYVPKIGASRILGKSERSTNTVKYMCMYNAVRLRTPNPWRLIGHSMTTPPPVP